MSWGRGFPQGPPAFRRAGRQLEPGGRSDGGHGARYRGRARWPRPYSPVGCRHSLDAHGHARWAPRLWLAGARADRPAHDARQYPAPLCRHRCRAHPLGGSPAPAPCRPGRRGAARFRASRARCPAHRHRLGQCPRAPVHPAHLRNANSAPAPFKEPVHALQTWYHPDRDQHRRPDADRCFHRDPRPCRHRARR
jgi:hypothetical protein